MVIDTLWTRLMQPCHTKMLYRFSNADGKTWLIPARHMRVAMNLYQPSSRNGKLLKALFPFLHRIAPLRKAIHAETVYLDLKADLLKLLTDVFHTEDMEFAIFCGTPCVHQKWTLQLSSGNQLLGYCKITDNNAVGELFRKEAALLETLNRKGVANIPQSLFCGKVIENIQLFVQSTKKTGKSEVVHHWTALHEGFLNDLHLKTRHMILFEQSDYWQTLNQLLEHLDWLPMEIDRTMMAELVHKVYDEKKGRIMDYSVYHADFTPWNMFVESGKLFVFDWEYTRMSYPPGLDRYHFFTQSALFERHWQVDDLIAYLKSSRGSWINKKRYSMYLLDAIARFTIREHGMVKGAVVESMLFWNNILKALNK